MATNLDRQRDVTRIALKAGADAGFALAGGGALREAVVSMTTALREHDYTVVPISGESEGFARLDITAPDGVSLEMDIGVDYRSKDPEQLEIGPVIALDDSVGSKVATAFSRGLPRDFLDLDSIRQSARYTDGELLLLAANVDAGFDPSWLANGIDHMVAAYPAYRFAFYDISDDGLAQVAERLSHFADWLRRR